MEGGGFYWVLQALGPDLAASLIIDVNRKGGIWVGVFSGFPRL